MLGQYQPPNLRGDQVKLAPQSTRLGLRIAAAAAAGALLVTPAAQAHDSVVGGNVHVDESLDVFPKEITLEFSAVPKEGFNTFAVTDTDTGEVLFDGEPTIDGRELTLPVPAGVTPEGENFQVGFQITSSDGHATRGSVPFHVKAAGEAASASGAASGAQESSSTSSSSAAEDKGGDEVTSPESLPLGVKLAAGLAGVLAVVAVAIVAIGRSRRS